MKLNQYFFLNLKNINDSNIKPKEIDTYVHNKFSAHHSWWYLTNYYSFYKGLSPYKPFINKNMYTTSLTAGNVHKNKYIFITSLYI